MVYIDRSNCDECGTCVCVCPENALTLAESLVVDEQRCTECCRCIDICPFGALHLPQDELK